VRFHRPLEQRIGDLISFPHVLDFFLGFHERRKFFELIEWSADENSDCPMVARRVEIFDVP